MLYSTTDNDNITIYGEDCLFAKAPSQGNIKILGRGAFLPKALFMHWWLLDLQIKFCYVPIGPIKGFENIELINV